MSIPKTQNDTTNQPVCTTGPRGTKFWKLNGERHRVDGPAIEHADGEKEWYFHDKPHRTDGPVIEYPNGYKAWYLNGEPVDEFVALGLQKASG